MFAGVSDTRIVTSNFSELSKDFILKPHIFDSSKLKLLAVAFTDSTSKFSEY